MKASYLLILLYILYGMKTVVQGQVQDTIYDEKELVQHLLDDYDPRARPVLNSADPVNVKFSINPIQISDMDEVNQVLTMNVWLRHAWRDERLLWDPQKYNNLSALALPEESVWLPDIFLYNSIESSAADIIKVKLIVRSNGQIEWGPPMRLYASCKIDVTYFPFDVQECLLKFGSWMYGGDQLNLSIAHNEVTMSDYVTNEEWEILNITAFEGSVVYDCCPNEPFPFVTYRVSMKRRVLYYVFNIILPCLWLAVLCVMMFWLPPDSGEKITLGITVLLAFSVFMLLVGESMPKTESVPLIGLYLTITMSLTSISILLTIIILQIHHVGPRQRKMPAWLRTFAFRHLARVLCVRGIVHNFVIKDRHDARIYTKLTPLSSSPTIISNCIQELTSNFIPESTSHSSTNSVATLAALTKLEAIMMTEMQRNARDRREEDEQKAIGDEWRLLAIILDRLFLWMYVLMTTGVVIGILVVIPISNIKKS